MIIIKKIILIIIIILLIIGKTAQADENYIIPQDAIRVRVIASSNSLEDQKIKQKVKETLENYLKNNLLNLTSINAARENIKENLDKLQTDIDKTLLENKINISYDINYGLNYFPSKKYKGVIYNEGYYESLVVTLGKGNGDNWWCVLFPPLCLLDNKSNLEVEYKFLVKELFAKIF